MYSDNENIFNPVFKESLKLYDAGFNVLPLMLDGNKRPDCYKIDKSGEWKQWKEKRLDRKHLTQVTADGCCGLGVIGGETSQGFEVLDFDVHTPGEINQFDNWKEAMSKESYPCDWLKKLIIYTSPSGGTRVCWRSPIHIGKPKEVLGRHPTGAASIELLCEQIIVVPGGHVNVHKLQKPYEYLQHHLTNTPIIPDLARDWIIGTAKKLNQYIEPPRPESPQWEQSAYKIDDFDESRPTWHPWQDFDVNGDWLFLEGVGWVQVGSNGWCRPGKNDGGGSATTDFHPGWFHLFSSNATYVDCLTQRETPLEPKAYSRSAIYAYLLHGGDFTASNQALAELGYGYKQMNAVDYDALDKIMGSGKEIVIEPEVPKTETPQPQTPAPEVLQVVPLPETPPVEKLINDPRTAYLWKDQHAIPQNVTEQDRQKRSESVIRAYDLLPKTGFLPDFLTAFLPTTDVSPFLLVGAALSAMCGIIGRNVKVMDGGRESYLLLWIALIAGSGERKSTALKYAGRILKHAGIHPLPDDFTWAALAAQIGVAVPNVPVALHSSDMQPDWAGIIEGCRLKEAMGDTVKGAGIFLIDELGGMLARLESDNNTAVKEVLTSAYEAQEYMKKTTKTAGNDLIWKPCLNMLAASTPAWMAARTTQQDLRGGWLGRWLLFISPGKDYDLTLCDNPNEEAFQRCLKFVESLKFVKGVVTLDQAARGKYCAWAKNLELAEHMMAWKTRIVNSCVKIAALYQISEGGSLTITEDTIDKASRLLNFIIAAQAEFVNWELVVDGSDEDTIRVKNIIRKYPDQQKGIPHWLALKKAKLKQGAEKFSKIINTLKQEESIIVRIIETAGRKALYYQYLKD